MHEGDLQTEHPPSRLGVDQLRAGLREMTKRHPDVLDLVCDVVHPGPATCKETTDRRVVPERREQLDATPADMDRRRFDALLLDANATLEPSAEETLVLPYGLVEIDHGEPDVMDPACLHCGDRM